MTKENKIRKHDCKKLSFELIVVFLGVTAGFLLNNWRSDLRESKTEQKYLVSFLKDVEDNITELKESISDDSLWLSIATPNLRKIQDHTISVDSAAFMVQQILQVSKFSQGKGTYLDIINSGNLNIISEFNLKSKIVGYHLDIDGVGFVDDYFYNYFNQFVMTFIVKEFDILRNEFRNKEIINSLDFSNIIAGYYSVVQQQKEAYENLLEESYSLKELLSKEIKHME